MDDRHTTTFKDALTTAAPIIELSNQEDALSSSESGSDSDQDERGSHISRSQQFLSSKNTVDSHGVPYLTLLSKHERRRIQLEVRKKKKPGNN